MPLISPAYRGPLVIFALGVGFSAVGAVPVAITFSLRTRSSATIIGMGFVGFGFLLMLPGAFWCLMVRTHSFKTLRRRLRRGRTNDEDDHGTEDEQTPALQKSIDELNGACEKATSPRSKCWPPSYSDPPPLIVTDYGVCRASTPIHQTALDDPDRPPDSAAADAADTETSEPRERTSPVTITVTPTLDDSRTPVAQHDDTVPTTDGTVPLCDA